LNFRLLVHDLFHLVGRQVLTELRVHLVIALEERLGRRDTFLDVAEHGLGRIELRLLFQKSDRIALSRKRLADETLVLAGHDFQQRALAGAVQAQDADLGAVVKRQPDVLEHFGVGRMNFPETLHRVDKLGHRLNADC